MLLLIVMSRLILFNKPMHVLCQFTDTEGRQTLADYVRIPEVYAAGRLDYDSEGLVVLTDDGRLQKKIADPKHKMPKTYLVQVEGVPTKEMLHRLADGVQLKDGRTQPAKIARLSVPAVWERVPPIRFRKDIPTSWLQLTITEGRNRQVRRMTAAVGLPTLRLIRWSIGPWSLDDLPPGSWKEVPQEIGEMKRHRPRR
jgi:23S rRNA pseudouridine2457 synthase